MLSSLSIQGQEKGSVDNGRISMAPTPQQLPHPSILNVEDCGQMQILEEEKYNIWINEKIIILMQHRSQSQT